MAKLHEALAVIDNLKGLMEKTRTDLKHAFTDKRHLFGERVVTFQSAEEGVPDVTEEQSSIQTTVEKELRWIMGPKFWEKAIDVEFQIADANNKANADLIVDGEVLLKAVPATALMNLKKRLTEMHDVLAAVPTLDPAKGFQLDDTRADGIYKASEDRRPRTKKRVRPLVLYEATKEHPAQVKEISEDVVIGHTLTQEWSALITPARKSQILERVEALKRGVQEALSRSNEQPIDNKMKVAKTLFDYVLTEKGAER